MSVLLNTIRMCQVYWGVTFHYYWMNTFFTTTMHLPCPRNLSEINQQHFLKLYTKWWFPFRIKVSFFAVQFFDVSSGYLIPCGYTNNSAQWCNCWQQLFSKNGNNELKTPKNGYFRGENDYLDPFNGGNYTQTTPRFQNIDIFRAFGTGLRLWTSAQGPAKHP